MIASPLMLSPRCFLKSLPAGRVFGKVIICSFHFCTLHQPSAFDRRPWCVPKELPPVGGITSVKFGCQEQDMNPSLHKKASKCAAEKLSLSLRPLSHPLLATTRKWILAYTDLVLPCTPSWAVAQSRYEN